MILLCFPHQFDDQDFGAQIAKLIQMFNLEVDDAFHMRLIDLRDTSVCNVFP